MKTNTAKNITKYLQSHGPVSAKDLAEHFNISRQALYKHLAKLSKDSGVYKVGSAPKVFYQVNETRASYGETVLPNSEREVVEKNYFIITPSGQKLEGAEGFIYWCEKNHLDVIKTATQYASTLGKFNSHKRDGIINGLPKLKSSFKKTYLDQLYYLDFYSIERFGKTKLGQMLLYAKQSQNKQLIKDLVLDIAPKIHTVIAKFKIQAISFIPPTVKREVQFMKELQKELNLKLPIINLVKIKTPITVPQKSLGKLEDRIENAAATIFAQSKNSFSNILLIDDAVGSGATMNETAKKLKTQKIATGKIIGLAITGSFKGFDVISEV